MKYLLTILAAAIAVVVMQVACAADVSWTGKGGVVDWNATTWSTGTPPAATDTVMFTGTQDYADFTVTPPADFAGTILVLNRTGQDFSAQFRTHLKIVNANNAKFTVGGTGIVEAFEGIESMFAEDFSGDVEIPVGGTFSPTAAFPSTAAAILGRGTFVPLTAAQLEKANLFNGTLDLRKIDAVTIGKSQAVLMGRDVILGSGVSVDEAKLRATVRKLDVGKASAWTLNSSVAATNPECVPTVDAAGTLTLPHVAGVANSTSAFLNRRFRADESFVLKFKVALTRGTYQCGFGCVMRSGELTDVGRSDCDAVTSGAFPVGCNGLAILNCHYWVDIDYFEKFAGAGRLATWGDDWRRHQPYAATGIDIVDGRPIDVTVVYDKLTLSTTLSKDGSSRTYRVDVSNAFKDARGAMLGFVSHESPPAEEKAFSATITDLQFWLSSEENGQWKADSNFAFGADNYYLYLDYKESADGDVKSFRGADALDAQGRLRICEGLYWFGAAISKNVVPNNKSFRIDWSVDVGSTAGGGEHTDIGLGIHADEANIKACYGDYDVADGSGYGTSARSYLTTGDPIKFCHSWYQNLVGMSCTWDTCTRTGQFTGTYENTSVFKTANSTNVGKMYFDGVSTYETKESNSSEGLVHTFTLTTTPSGTRHLAVVGDGSTVWTCYTQNWLKDISLSYWDDDYEPEAFVRLAAVPGTATMVGAGKYAPIESVSLADATSRIKFTGTVAFGKVLEIVVPDEFLKAVRTKVTLLDWSAATIARDLPTTVKLVDGTGAVVDLRGRKATVTANGVELSAPPGLFIVLK